MPPLLRSRLSPALLISLLALFFAIGGSAFAVSARFQPQARCAPGAVRGIAYVTGDVRQGLRNAPTTYSSAASLFAYRWNCAGGTVSLKRNGDAYDILFGGNRSRTALGSAYTSDGASVSVTRNADGSFHVVVQGVGGGGSVGTPLDFVPRPDLPFVIVLV